jgi:hypothetical protein
MKDSLQKISNEAMLIMDKANTKQRKKTGKRLTYKEMIGLAVAEKYGK